LIVAVPDPIVIVSVVFETGVRVTFPTELEIVPWNAPLGADCACAGCGASAAAAIANGAQDSIKDRRLSSRRAH
jgi:hypothetical protein